MNIEGLDYNTQREQLILPEYGREIQNMVDYAVSLPTKQERQHCAEHQNHNQKRCNKRSCTLSFGLWL